MDDSFSAKSVLIVAKKLEDLGTLRAFFGGQGAKEISVASSANMAINMLRSQRYAICVIEAHLGDGEKSGLQVIEEANAEGLLPATSSCVLITPSTTRTLPNYSVESSADTFIKKPFQFDKLKARLDKLLRLKRAVRPMEALIDKGDVDAALLMCDQMVKTMPTLRAYVYRIKGRLLVRKEAYCEALAHFSGLISESNYDWAHLGAGVCYYKLGRYPEAINCFDYLLQLYPGSIESYDWLAKVYRGIGENQRAQQLLEQATRVLPTAPAIQSVLGDVASENCNWNVAIAAFRSAVKYACHSYHQTQTNYFGLARSLQTQIKRGGGEASSSAEREAVRTMEDVIEEYFDDDLIRFKSRLMNSETFKRSGDLARANAAARDAFDVYQTLEPAKQAEELDNLMEGVEGTSIETAAVDFKGTFNKKVYTDTDWGRSNLKGMTHYRQGQFDEAFQCFSVALEQVENSPSILLNLVQTGYELIRNHPDRSQEILAVCNEKLLNMSIGALNTKQQERCRLLSLRRTEVVAANGVDQGGHL
jgi:tetratricopeptide (TPR) repeat protein